MRCAVAAASNAQPDQRAKTMEDHDEYLDAQSPLDFTELENAATDVMATISGVLAGLEYQLAVFEHHNRGDDASLKLSRELAVDVHADVCSRLREFGRRS
jgi:hypothetical protein